MSAKIDPALAAPRRIVVGVDAEGHSGHAIQAAMELGRKLRADVTFVHAVGSAALDWAIVEDPRAAAKNAGVLTKAWKAVTAHVRVLLDASAGAQSEAPDGTTAMIDDRVLVLPGQPAKVILDEAVARDADLIVLGFDPRRGRFGFGSTARHVLAKAPKAVWIQKTASVAIQRILVPIDLSPDSLRALSAACGLARAFDASVRALHCFQTTGYLVSTWPEYPGMGGLYPIDDIRKADEQEFERAMKSFDWRGVEHTTESVEGDPIAKILESQSAADLIVLGTHGRTGLSAAVLGNVAYSVMRHAKVPVLAIRHPEREFMV